MRLKKLRILVLLMRQMAFIDESIIITADNLIFTYLQTVFDVVTMRDFRLPHHSSWELPPSWLLRGK
jgi:hypothetical protein